ncbi:unnamed protein product [Bursaphelenchus xylophilus]|uniref:(pine wood nematode) hypothetical protein n=1 Tax=Bursaphelenchus xylophilus TaxID=6326 RepID=A0A1I7RKN4_BURXY|nr:unnamed protein product [Bursaphelenchus xylophilus]CAG9131203.1 unnamed protein product [Bursaphelenchus xylophilus]
MKPDSAGSGPPSRLDLNKFREEAARRRKEQREKYEKELEEIASMGGVSKQDLLNSISKSLNGSELVISFSNSYSEGNQPNSSAHGSSSGSSKSNFSKPSEVRSATGRDPPFMAPTIGEGPLRPSVPMEISPINPVPPVKRSALRDVTSEKKAPKAEEPVKKPILMATPLTRKTPSPKPASPPKSPSKSTKSLIRIKDRTYMLQKVVGKGGSCQVYQAVDASNEDMKVAVKIVDLSNCNDRMKRIYMNEVKILEELQGNDYVVKLIAFEVKNSKLYVVMELGERSLAAFIEEVKNNKREIDQHFLRYHWAEMLRCVNTIHQKNIIHSDLKPANFLLVNGRLKLIDFGIAAKINDREESIIQEGGMGTPNFMSPEAVGFRFDNRAAFEITLKTDVWSLGCMLYALIYGTTPFNHLKGNSMKIHAIKSMVIKFDKVDDPQLLDTLKKCFERDPAKRPTVQELLQHPYLTSRSSKENQMDVTLADTDFLTIAEQIQNSTPKTAARTMKAIYKDLKHKNNQ